MRIVQSRCDRETVTLDHDLRLGESVRETLESLTPKEHSEVRYTLSEGDKEELLRRLLELNFKIAEQEAKEAEKQTKWKV